jgi:hypothetical protein
MLKKLIPKNYILKFSFAEKNETVSEENPNRNSSNLPEYGDSHILVVEQEGTNINGEKVVIPIGTEVIIVGTGSKNTPTKLMGIIDGSFINFELPTNELRFNLEMDIAAVSITTKTDYAINRLKDLKDDDWSSIFVDASSDKISFILKSFNKVEQQTFLEKDGLKYFVNWELNAPHITQGIADWDIPLIDKLNIIKKENVFNYSIYRKFFIDADLTGFDIKRDYTLLPLKSKTVFATFLRDCNLPPNDKKWLQKKIFKKEDPVPLKKPLYDDLFDKERKLKISKDQLHTIAKIEEEGFNHISSEDKNKATQWFQENALTETFSLLDFSETQIKNILNRYAGKAYNSLEEDFMKVMDSPYADGHYSHRKALSIRGNDATSNEIAQREVQKSVKQKLGDKHPIVYVIKDFKKLIQFIEKKDADKLQNYLENKLIERLQNIEKTRQELRSQPNFVWDLNNIIKNTFHNLGIKPSSSVGQVILEKQQEHKTNKAFISLALAAFSIGLGVLASFASGGLSLVVTGAALGVGAYDFSRESLNYSALEAAANSSLKQAEALTQEQPEFIWVAMAGLGVLGDVSAVAKLLKNIKIGKLNTPSDIDLYTDEVTNILAKEKGISIDPTNPDFTKLRNLVKSEAVEQLERIARTKNAQKQFDYKRFQDARFELILASRVYTNVIVALVHPKVLTNLTKYLKEAILNGANSLEDALEKVAFKVDGTIKKFNVEIDDHTKTKELQEIFNTVLQGVREKQQKSENALKAVEQLATIPKDKIQTNQTAIETAWKDFLKETPSPRVNLEVNEVIQNIPVSFSKEGKMTLWDNAGNKIKLSEETLKKKIYEELGISHAAENHNPNKLNRKLAVRTLNPKNSPQNSKFKNDQVFIMCCEFAKKKCFDAHGKFDVVALLKAGIIKKASKSYEFVVPVPKGFGTIYFNTKHSSNIVPPNWLKLGKTPFPKDQGLKDIIEIPLIQLKVIFDEEGNIMTTYPIGF